MYQVGEYIVYGNVGVCLISEITPKCFDGITEKLYYTLVPLEESKEKVYTPVENTKIVFRSLLSEKETLDLIDRMKEIETIWEDDEHGREKKYQSCLQSGECEELVKVIKTLYQRKQSRLRDGKKIATTDEKYLKLTENRLFEELAFVLGKEKDDMKAFIMERIKRLK